MPWGKGEEQSREKNGKAFTAHASSESVSNAKEQIKGSESFSAEVKKQVNELGKPFAKATDSKHSASIQNILNRTQQQQSRERQ